MRPFILFACFCFFGLFAADAFGQTTRSRAVSMSSTQTLGHFWGLPAGVRHEGIGMATYGGGTPRIVARAKAVSSACQSGGAFIKTRTVCRNGQCTAVRHTR